MTPMGANRFEADVRQILHLVTHSLYSDREIFLRELVSNASDALDKAHFVGLQRDDLRSIEGEPSIRVSADAEAGTITIEDDGIGLTAEEASEHLGTCLLYTSPSPRDRQKSRMPSSA